MQDAIAALCSGPLLTFDTFAERRRELNLPGLYAWHADGVAAAAIGDALEIHIDGLIYVGQAGATSWPSGRVPSTTLASRIGGNHFRGSIYGSTFRLTLAALLEAHLHLQRRGPKRLERESERALSAWIREHLAVRVYLYEDRSELGGIEAGVVQRLDPPLNLHHVGRTPSRIRLRHLRREMGKLEVGSADQ